MYIQHFTRGPSQCNKSRKEIEEDWKESGKTVIYFTDDIC